MEGEEIVEIPDRLECLFSTSVDQRGESYCIEIPRDELEQGSLRSDETYRIAVLPRSRQESDTDTRQQRDSVPPSGRVKHASQTPAVAKGDMREVTIETIGDQGDDIAKVEHGYVVIVPEADEAAALITELVGERTPILGWFRRSRHK